LAHGPPCAGNRKAMPHIRAPLIPNTTSRARKSTPQRHDCSLLKPVSLNRDTLARALSWPPIAKMPQAQPELKKYLEKRVLVQLNGSRKVMGVLRGYDVYLNIVLDEALEEKAGGEKTRIGMVVIRGNAVVMLEALDRINQDVPKIGR